MDVDRARLAVVRAAPERLEQHLARVDAARVRGERAQQLELDVRELHGRPAHLDRAPREVDAEAVDLDHVTLARVVAGRGRAAQERAHAAAELPDRERLRDVVVGAELEPEHLVELVVAGGEHDDRHGALRAQPLADLEPVELREHHVEHDQVDRLVAELPQRLLAVARLDDAEAVALERVGEELLDRVLVVDEEDRGGVWHRPMGRSEACPPYYSPRCRRYRPARGARARAAARIERPVNGRLYRGTWLLVGLPLLVAAFSVARPQPLPAPSLPPAFDRATALSLAQELARTHPDRRPGTSGDAAAARWLEGKLGLYGFRPVRDRFEAHDARAREGPARERQLASPAAARRTRSSCMAHRDNTGAGPGANDNASGTAALVELARVLRARPVRARRDAGAHDRLPLDRRRAPRARSAPSISRGPTRAASSRS